MAHLLDQVAFAPVSSKFLFTSESVTEGHPDKVADQISDSVLDAVLSDDTGGRVACETLITTGLVVVAGEITTETYVDIPRLVRERIAEIEFTGRGAGDPAWEAIALETLGARLRFHSDPDLSARGAAMLAAIMAGASPVQASAVLGDATRSAAPVAPGEWFVSSPGEASGMPR